MLQFLFRLILPSWNCVVHSSTFYYTMQTLSFLAASGPLFQIGRAGVLTCWAGGSKSETFALRVLGLRIRVFGVGFNV